jgi:hypothetical protein
MGAFELDYPLPHYGPRPWLLSIFADGFESGDASAWTLEIF